MASRFEERLDRMIEAAKASDRPYKALEGKPFNLSASVARTIVVGSGLSKSDSGVREREAKRIAKWREQGHFGPAKATPEPAPIVIPDDEPITAAETDAVAAEQVTAKPRKRAPKKDGKASAVAREIAANREPVGATA